MRAAAVPSAGSVLDQIHSALGETGGGR
jgi:hypothetical protein